VVFGTEIQVGNDVPKNCRRFRNKIGASWAPSVGWGMGMGDQAGSNQVIVTLCYPSSSPISSCLDFACTRHQEKQTSMAAQTADKLDKLNCEVDHF